MFHANNYVQPNHISNNHNISTTHHSTQFHSNRYADRVGTHAQNEQNSATVTSSSVPSLSNPQSSSLSNPPALNSLSQSNVNNALNSGYYEYQQHPFNNYNNFQPRGVTHANPRFPVNNSGHGFGW